MMKLITKQEAHQFIDAMPEGNIMLMKYNPSIGMSEKGRQTDRGECKQQIDKAETISYAEDFIVQMDLYKKFVPDVNSIGSLKPRDLIATIVSVNK